MQFFLSVYEDRRELIELARRVWSAFGEAHMHPLAERQPDRVGQTNLRVGDYAGVFVTDRFLNLVLATELLENTSRPDQQLTLLHECIHMDFAGGEHKDRWLMLNRRIAEQNEAITQASPTTAEEADEQGDAQRRHLAAVLFLRLPDEIVAEQRLKQDYQPWFGERAKYYVRMRQRREADLAAPASGVALRLNWTTPRLFSTVALVWLSAIDLNAAYASSNFFRPIEDNPAANFARPDHIEASGTPRTAASARSCSPASVYTSHNASRARS